MKEIIFFSNNQNKINEVSNLFVDSPVKILTLNNFKKINSPKENGNTFEDNAKIKSLYGFKNFKKICFADDSGICIESMNNKPGVNSKSYLDSKNNPYDKLNEIIKMAKTKNNFSCFFQTIISLTLKKNKSIVFGGRVNGSISKEIKGTNGFGYDPIFIPDGQNLTFAEMTILKKNSLSHRSIALKKLNEYILSNLIF